MKTLFKAIAIASLATATAAQAQLSASVGVDSSYIYRGLELDGSTTASATVEYTVAGFTLGAWVADANESGFVETDLSIAYTAAVAGHDITVSFTDYSYDFDGDTDLDDFGEQEITVATTVSGLGISYTDGTIDDGIADVDYSIIAVDYTFSNTNVLLANVNSDGNSTDYSYFEISAPVGQIAGLDVALTYTGTFSEDDFSIAADQANNAFVIGLSKAFDL
jgi:hypothetical protein